MWSWIAFGLVVCLGAMAVTQYWLQRRLRRRALRALRWIENSLGTCGHVSGMRWLNHSQFEVPLKVVHPIFHRAFIQVTLQPVSGLFRKSEPEMLTFHADLDLPPTFAMAFEKLRWFARTDKRLSTDAPGWQVENCSPVVLTTRLDWERDVTNAIYAVLHADRSESLNVVFRKASPNFSATLPLEAISPDLPEPLAFLDVLRELAEGVALNKAS